MHAQYFALKLQFCTIASFTLLLIPLSSPKQIKTHFLIDIIRRERTIDREPSPEQSAPPPVEPTEVVKQPPKVENDFFMLIVDIIFLSRWCQSRPIWRWSRLTPTGPGRGGATSPDPGLSKTVSPSFLISLLQTRKTRRDPVSCLSPTISLYYALMGIYKHHDLSTVFSTDTNQWYYNTHPEFTLYI